MSLWTILFVFIVWLKCLFLSGWPPIATYSRAAEARDIVLVEDRMRSTGNISIFKIHVLLIKYEQKVQTAVDKTACVQCFRDQSKQEFSLVFQTPPNVFPCIVCQTHPPPPPPPDPCSTGTFAAPCARICADAPTHAQACTHTRSFAKQKRIPNRTFSAPWKASLLAWLPWWLRCMFELSITLQQKNLSLPLSLSLSLSLSNLLQTDHVVSSSEKKVN